MTGFFCRPIRLKSTQVIWTVDTLTSQLSSSELDGGALCPTGFCSKSPIQGGGCDLGGGGVVLGGVPSYPVTKGGCNLGGVLSGGLCPITTNDRHEASRVLSVTAGLLVLHQAYGYVAIASPIIRALSLRAMIRLSGYSNKRLKSHVGGINLLECEGNYSATSNNMKLIHWPWVGWYILYSEEGTWRGRSPPRLLAVPNVTASHQQPVYQSPYCCIVVG